MKEEPMGVLGHWKAVGTDTNIWPQMTRKEPSLVKKTELHSNPWIWKAVKLAMSHCRTCDDVLQEHWCNFGSPFSSVLKDRRVCVCVCLLRKQSELVWGYIRSAGVWCELSTGEEDRERRNKKVKQRNSRSSKKLSHKGCNRLVWSGMIVV